MGIFHKFNCWAQDVSRFTLKSILSGNWRLWLSTSYLCNLNIGAGIALLWDTEHVMLFFLTLSKAAEDEKLNLKSTWTWVLNLFIHEQISYLTDKATFFNWWQVHCECDPQLLKMCENVHLLNHMHRCIYVDPCVYVYAWRGWGTN